MNCTFLLILTLTTVMAQVNAYQEPAPAHHITHTRNLQSLAIDKQEEKLLVSPENITIPLATTFKNNNITDISDPDRNVLRDQARNAAYEALRYIENHSLDESFSYFSQSNQFLQRGLNLLVIDFEGQCFFHKDEPSLVWTNIYDKRDTFGSYVVRTMIKKAQQKGGWAIYEWNGGIKHSFIKPFEKDGITYLLGCDYYSHSQETLVVALVQGAVELIKGIIAEGRDIKEGFSIISYPLSRFSIGDLYVFANDFKGVSVADNFKPGSIGSDELDLRSDTGVQIIKKFIEVLKPLDLETGTWVEYKYRRSTIRVYLRKVQDNQGNFYVLGCGYYPEIDRKTVIDLVDNGYELMKRTGVNESSLLFSAKMNNEFIQGPLYLTVYDRKGICIADGNNPDIVGQNKWNDQDQDGHYYVRNFIKEAESHPAGAWINARFRNSLYSFFVRYVDLGIEEFVLVCGYTPLSSTEEMVLLTKSAISFMQNNDRYQTFSEFVRKKGNFMRGNLSVIVVGETGICYAFGQEPELTWQNLYSGSSKKAGLFQTNITNFSTPYKIFNLSVQKRFYTIYMEKMKKDNRIFSIGAALYL